MKEYPNVQSLGVFINHVHLSSIEFGDDDDRMIQNKNRLKQVKINCYLISVSLGLAQIPHRCFPP